jgi:hypothetical protein
MNAQGFDIFKFQNSHMYTIMGQQFRFHDILSKEKKNTDLVLKGCDSAKFF